MSEIFNFSTAVQAAFAEELDRFIDLIGKVDKNYMHQGTSVEVEGLAYLPSALKLAEKNDAFGIVKALRPIVDRLN